MNEAGAADGAPRSPLSLPRARRLRRHNDFLRVERTGQRVHGQLVTLVARPGRGRIGFTVSKKVSLKATERNLVKRRLREVVRAHRAWWAALDVVVVARVEAVGATLRALTDDVARAAERLSSSSKARGRGRDGSHGDKETPRS